MQLQPFGLSKFWVGEGGNRKKNEAFATAGSIAFAIAYSLEGIISPLEVVVEVFFYHECRENLKTGTLNCFVRICNILSPPCVNLIIMN